MSVKRWALVSIIAAFLLTIAGFGLNGVWAQDTPTASATVAIGDAQLLAKGAAVAVPLIVTCTGITDVRDTFGRVFLSQRTSGKTLVHGEAFFSLGAIVCDGSAQTATGNVTPFSSPFKKGLAFAQASVQICGFSEAGGEYGGFTCTFASAEAEIRIR